MAKKKRLSLWFQWRGATLVRAIRQSITLVSPIRQRNFCLRQKREQWVRSAEEDRWAEITSWFDIGTCLTLVKWYIGLWSEIPKEKDCEVYCKHYYAKSDGDDVKSAVHELLDCFQLTQCPCITSSNANGDEISTVTSMTGWIAGNMWWRWGQPWNRNEPIMTK